MLMATEAMIVPTVNSAKAARSTDFRPMIWEKEAQVGWKTVEHSKKLVPHQKACIAVVPFKLVAMILNNVVSKTTTVRIEGILLVMLQKGSWHQ
jgi:hypothetical protein